MKSYLKELFNQWELLFFFCWRDILVRYKQTFLGVAWAVIRPLLNMALFAYLFGKIAHLPSDGINYSLFVLAGMLPWQLFANSIQETSTCFINNPTLITKVFFFRMILPISQILVQMVDFGINLLLFFLLACTSLNFFSLVTLPLFFLLLLLLCLGVSFWLSALTVRFRDIRFIVPFLLQFGMFASPVGYGSFIINHPLYYCNPMVGIIDGFRFAFFGVAHENFCLSLSLSAAVTLFLFASGLAYFRAFETSFADRI